jgi:riboflavin kinase / FMN adenylyltransferase
MKVRGHSRTLLHPIGGRARYDADLMQVLHGLRGLRQAPEGAVMSIGNFDGIHLGHARILERARELRNGAPVVVVTFEPHPLTVLRPEAAPPRLTTPAVKEQILSEMGVDRLVVLPPAPEVLNLTAEQFWAILRDEVQPRHLVEGESFYFGKGRGGDVRRLREWSAGTAVELHVVEAVEVVLSDLAVVPVSSSLIRWLLANGRVRDAAMCLGRAYLLEGEVVKGYGRGRGIDMPTANLRCGDQMIPLDGVYAGRCEVDGRTFPAGVSVGTMPTFGEHERQVEAHLVDFDGDLYGKTMRVELLDWLREQRKYGGIEPLMEQLKRDIDQTRRRVGLDPARPLARAG